MPVVLSDVGDGGREQVAQMGATAVDGSE